MLVPKKISGGFLVNEGNFSDLFPKTWAYLIGFVKAKYPSFKSELPDINVKIIVRTRSEGFFSRIWYRSEEGTYAKTNRFGKPVIIFYLNFLTGNQKVLMKLITNPPLTAKFIDNNEQARSSLIHEYQHFLQRTLQKVEVSKELKEKHKKYLIMKIVHNSIRHSEIGGFFVAGFKGAILGYLLGRIFSKKFEIFLPKTKFMTSEEMLYELDPMEIEARLSQVIYEMVVGKKEAYGKLSSFAKKTEEELKRDIEVLNAGIKEHEELLKNADWKQRRLFKKRIKYMQKLLWEYETRLEMMPKLMAEAEIIATLVKEVVEKES